MKLTIVADDGAVGIDGEYFGPLDISQLDPNIHALQWYDNFGEVEFKTKYENGSIIKPENAFIDDISSYQFAIDAWQIAKNKSMEDGFEIPTSELS